MTEDKIARICWNTEGWRKPSGMSGKSKHKKAYERKVGYGHEEWLLDTTKLIDGWHFAHLQPIGLHQSKYIGKQFNISLYSINGETKRRWWVGRIRNVTVTNPTESQKAYSIYKKNGWLKEMEGQLKNVGASINAFRKINPSDFFVVRFRPSSLELLDTPMEFLSNDRAVRATYYNLLNQTQKPNLMQANDKFIFTPGHKKKKSSSKSTYEGHSSNIDLVQNRIQTNIYNQLVKQFGKDNVGTEVDTGLGSQVDIVIKEGSGKFTFYEIKSSYSVRLCIREAIAQLLEYAYYPNNNNSKKLIITSPNPVTSEAKSYLENLRNKFSIPVYYQRYNSETEALDKVLY